MLQCIVEIINALADARQGNMGALLGEMDWRYELAAQFEDVLAN